MARKTKITLRSALEAIEGQFIEEEHWRFKAIDLLQLVGVEGVDQEKLIEKCKQHAEIGKDL